MEIDEKPKEDGTKDEKAKEDEEISPAERVKMLEEKLEDLQQQVLLITTILIFN